MHEGECMRVWEYVQGCLCDLYFVQFLHYFNVSLLARLISVILSFNIFYFLTECVQYRPMCVFMCNI